MRDTEAVASIVAGEPDGLAAAYDRYADPLYTYCRTLLGDTAEAADAVQDTFVIAAARLDRLRDPQRLRAWLFAVARGECLRVLRSKTRTQPPPRARDVTGGTGHTAAVHGPGDPGAARDAGGGDEDERAGLRMLFEHARAGLSPGDREIIELQLRQGLKPGEVAIVLGVSRGRAHTLLARAGQRLESCLGALLVGRAGREGCAGLGAMLAGWDGRLSPALSMRVDRHIEHCAVCGARRAAELRPSAMREMTPAAALAAGAVESFRHAPGAPAGLKSHTIALATGHGSLSAAHAAAVLSRAGTFGKEGFPRQARGVPGPAGAGPRHGARSSHRRAAVAAAVILAAGVAAAGFALSGGRQHLPQAAGPRPPVSSADPAAATMSAATARITSAAASAARRSPTGRGTTPTAVITTQAATTTHATAPTTATASRTPSAGPSAGPSATAPNPSPTASASSSPSQPAGTLRVFPGGGSLFLVPGGRGALLFLSASGGTVDWSVSVSGDPGHTITVSPAASGTLTAAHHDAILTITASQDLSCGDGGNPCPTITVEPGGTVLTVSASGRRHPFGHRRRHRSQDGLPAAHVTAGWRACGGVLRPWSGDERRRRLGAIRVA